MLELGTFGTVNFATEVICAVVKHNQQVDKNGYILSFINYSIKFCCAFELFLRGQNENNS